MLVYDGIKSSFIEDVDLNQITDKIYEKYRVHFGNTSEAEIRSWANSMQRMRGVLSARFWCAFLTRELCESKELFIGQLLQL